MTNKKTNKRSVGDAVAASHKKANIIVGIVAGITLLLLITVIVLCTVTVTPLDGLKSPEESKNEYYALYDLNATESLPNNSQTQSKIRTALDDMKFTVMNAVLQWNWDYSYNFVKNSSGKKITMTSDEVVNKSATSSEYMVEIVYSPAVIDGELVTSEAQSLSVDGEIVYFDRIKILIGNTNNDVGEIYLYPYLYERATNKVAGDGVPYETYRITPIKVRANTTNTYAALARLVTSIKNN